MQKKNGNVKRYSFFNIKGLRYGLVEKKLNNDFIYVAENSTISSGCTMFGLYNYKV